jgi:hypothetical protein
MNKRYQIIRTERIDDKVRLSLKPDDLVREKQPGLKEMMLNPTGIVELMKQDAVFSQCPDLITIPYVEWKKHQYKLDDFVLIDLEPGK